MTSPNNKAALEVWIIHLWIEILSLALIFLRTYLKKFAPCQIILCLIARSAFPESWRLGRDLCTWIMLTIQNLSHSAPERFMLFYQRISDRPTIWPPRSPPHWRCLTNTATTVYHSFCVVTCDSKTTILGSAGRHDRVYLSRGTCPCRMRIDRQTSCISWAS